MTDQGGSVVLMDIAHGFESSLIPSRGLPRVFQVKILRLSKMFPIHSVWLL